MLGYEYCYVIRYDVIHVAEQMISCHTVTPNRSITRCVGRAYPYEVALLCTTWSTVCASNLLPDVPIHSNRTLFQYDCSVVNLPQPTLPYPSYIIEKLHVHVYIHTVFAVLCVAFAVACMSIVPQYHSSLLLTTSYMYLCEVKK